MRSVVIAWGVGVGACVNLGPTTQTNQPLSPEEDRRRRGIPDVAPKHEEEASTKPSKLFLKLAANYVFASTDVYQKPSYNISCCSGPSITAAGGYRPVERLTLGLEASLGRLTGSYNYMGGLDHDMLLVPVDVGLLVELGVHPRLWLTANIGAHYDYLTEPTLSLGMADPIDWHSSIGAGFGVRIELFRHGAHTLSAVATIQGSFATFTDYEAIKIGIGYAR